MHLFTGFMASWSSFFIHASVVVALAAAKVIRLILLRLTTIELNSINSVYPTLMRPPWPLRSPLLAYLKDRGRSIDLVVHPSTDSTNNL